MDDVEEKRVFDDRAGKTDLLVAADVGVLAVETAGDRVGRFGVVHRCDPVDVASGDGRLAVATDDDVLLGENGSDAFEPTEFGPAVAVGFDGDAPVAAAPDGRVARFEGGGDANDRDREWTDLGQLDAEVRSSDGRLLAATDGVYRLPGLSYAGLDDARDVAGAGPLVATGHGLYSLGNGWVDELSGAFRVAASDGDRAHAATADAFFERVSGEWREVDLPADGPVVDLAYGEATYVITTDGILLADAGDGWRSHPLGVEGVVGCAVR